MKLVHAFAFAAVFALTACRSAPQLHADRTQVLTGEDIVVTIDGSLEGRAFDQYWIALQPAEAPVTDVSGRIVLERREHEVRFHTTAPGAYEVRLHDRYPKVEHHLVARLPILVDGYPVKTAAQLEVARP